MGPEEPILAMREIVNYMPPSPPPPIIIQMLCHRICKETDRRGGGHNACKKTDLKGPEENATKNI